jgi:hypothetical protein
MFNLRNIFYNNDGITLIGDVFISYELYSYGVDWIDIT